MQTLVYSKVNSRAGIAAAGMAVVLFVITACAKGADSAKMDTAAPTGTPAVGSAATAPDSMSLVRGTVASVSPTELVVKTDSGASVTVKIPGPVQVFSRGAGDLSHVTQNSFIGVTTVKQPDGAERATEIHIFPEELRGLGEGSRMMTPPSGAATSGSPASRMTNGSVSAAAPAAGAVPASRMSNGNVASTNGSTLVVQYAGGSQNVTVPPKTPISEIKLVQQPLAVGDNVVVVATKGTDGSLSSSKALLMTK